MVNPMPGSYTSEDLEKLEKAIASGVRSVKYTDKEITYRSLDDMIKARDLIRMELGLTDNPRGSRRVATTCKGL